MFVLPATNPLLLHALMYSQSQCIDLNRSIWRTLRSGEACMAHCQGYLFDENMETELLYP